MNTLLAGAILIGLLCVNAGNAVPRPGKPPAEALLAASRLVEESYQRDLDAAVTPVLKRALAKKLLDAAKVDNDAANKYALLQKSLHLAAAIGDLTLVLEVVEETERSFDIEASTIHQEAIQQLLQSAKTPSDHYLLARYIARITSRLEELNQLEAAKALAAHGLAAANKSRDPDCVLQWKRRIEDLERRTVVWQKVQEALATLEEQPADPVANRVVGAYRCIYANDWASGLSMLALGDVATWQVLAEGELQPNLTTDARVKLADGWFEASKNADRSTQSALLARAAAHYQSALPQLTGLTQRRVEIRLAEVKKTLSPFSAGEWVEVLDLPRLTERIDHGTWEEVGLTLVSGDGSAVITLPAPVDRPYEARILVQDFRQELQLYPFPNPYSAQIVINGWKGEHTQLYGINGSYDDHSTRVKAFRPSPGVTTFDIRVEHKGTKRSLKLRINGRPYFAWAGPIDALRAPTNGPSEERTNLVLVTAGTPTTFLSVRLRQSKALED